MVFASPIWLLGLLPWLAAVAYLLRGYRPVRRVPFLALWPMELPLSPRPRRRLPSLPILLMLLAMLLGVLSLAQPQWIRRGMYSPPVVLLDRGISLQPEARAQRLASAVARVFSGFDPAAMVEVHPVPGRPSLWHAGEIQAAILAAGPIPVETSLQVQRERASLRARGEAILLVTGGPSPVPAGDNLMVLQDDQRPLNVGLARMAFTARPAAELMLWIYNDTPQREAMVEVRGWASLPVLTPEPAFTFRQPVRLPEQGKRASCVLTLGSVVGDGMAPAIVTAKLLTGDTIACDDEAWLVRRSHAPRPLARGVVPPSLQQLLGAYAHVRLGSNGAGQAAPGQDEIVVTTGELRAGEAGMLVDADAAAEGGIQESLRGVRLSEFPGLRNLPLPREAAVAPVGPPGRGWRNLLSLGDKPLLAWRESPRRQVWVGFWSAGWSQSPDFVVFHSKVLDWIGGGSDIYEGSRLTAEATGLRALSPTSRPAPWPGVYETVAGPVAMNAPMPEASQGSDSPDVAESPVATLATPAASLDGLSLRPAVIEFASAGWLATILLTTAALWAHAWRRRGKRSA